MPLHDPENYRYLYHNIATRYRLEEELEAVEIRLDELFANEQRIVLVADDIDTCLAGLGAREQAVIDLRFGISSGQPVTLADAGRLIPNMSTGELGVSSEQTRRIEGRGLRRLYTCLRQTRLGQEYIHQPYPARRPNSDIDIEL